MLTGLFTYVPDLRSWAPFNIEVEREKEETSFVM